MPESRRNSIIGGFAPLGLYPNKENQAELNRRRRVLLQGCAKRHPLEVCELIAAQLRLPKNQAYVATQARAEKTARMLQRGARIPGYEQSRVTPKYWLSPKRKQKAKKDLELSKKIQQGKNFGLRGSRLTPVLGRQGGAGSVAWSLMPKSQRTMLKVQRQKRRKNHAMERKWVYDLLKRGNITQENAFNYLTAYQQLF